MASEKAEWSSEDGCEGQGSGWTSTAGAVTPGLTAPPAESGVCRFFLRGRCHFGPRCRLLHSEVSVGHSGAAVSHDQEEEVDGGKEEEEEEEDGRKKGLSTQTTGGKGADRKPRMRTADDVISRILWDPAVRGSEFVVGYLDRFLGVVERPFCEFSWDTSPCDWDQSTELALPRHRIQYFSHRGRRVWDRLTRTDRVFGSTGQPVAPPFGEEEEEEFQQEVDGSQSPDRPAHGEWPGCEGEEEEQEAQGGVDDRPSADPPHPQIVVGGVTGGEGRDSCHDDEDDDDVSDSAAPPALPLPLTPPAPRPPKKKPTHFVSFRADTPAALSCFQQLQEEVTALLPAAAPHWSAPAHLHVTLCLLVLPTPAEVAAAVEILRRFACWDRNPPVAVTFPLKLKTFGGRVLYLSPRPQLDLQQLNGGLQEAYRGRGLLHRHSYAPRYHLTLAKVKEEGEGRPFEGVGHLKVGRGLTFGRLPVNTLHLCVVERPPVDAFYQSVCTVTLR